MKYLVLLRRNPGFARLWYAQAISFIGDWFNYIAVATIVTHYAGVSGIAISGLLLARFLPPLLASPVAGVLVDRRNRRHLMIASDVARAVIVVGFLFINESNWSWLPYFLVVLHASLGAVFEPARSAFMPSVIGGEDLVTANLLSSVTWSVMLAIGGATGGLVAGLWGTNTAFVIDALSFVVSAALVYSIRSHDKVVETPLIVREKSQNEGSFGEGLHYIRTHPATAATMLVKLGGNIGSFDTLLVLYATSLFVVGDNGSISTGMLYAAFGIGAILGPLIIDRFNDESVRKMRRLISIGYALIALGLFLMAGAPVLIAALGAVLIKAMGSSVYWTYSSVILQKTVEDRFLGRIFAFDQAGFQFATVVSTVITGSLTEGATSTELRTVVFATAILSFVPFILWTISLPWIERHAKREKEAALAQAQA